MVVVLAGPSRARRSKRRALSMGGLVVSGCTLSHIRGRISLAIRHIVSRLLSITGRWEGVYKRCPGFMSINRVKDSDSQSFFIDYIEIKSCRIRLFTTSSTQVCPIGQPTLSFGPFEHDAPHAQKHKTIGIHRL